MVTGGVSLTVQTLSETVFVSLMNEVHKQGRLMGQKGKRLPNKVINFVRKKVRDRPSWWSAGYPGVRLQNDDKASR